MKKKQTSGFDYQQEAFGTWGRFKTPAGVVDFLETKARLDTRSTDPETRLTRFLKPVREALSSADMDFNQLLQRDLDDHRVATELVPYLLKSSVYGPAFFPPVVAVLLPFSGKDPQQDFPPRTDIVQYEDDLSHWKGYAFGEAFKFEQDLYADGSFSLAKSARLSWNDERAKLVVIDGQHRAMALLAVFRSLDTWEGEGEKYRHFYEGTVQELLGGTPRTEWPALFADIEIPVTIVWFPELKCDTGRSHQRAARKLFVDVNKNARPPSASRVLLLSDTQLSAIMTRKVLNEFRNADTETLPIYAIEYDHPERDQSHSAKWSAVTNVSIIHGCIYRAVLGPAKYINDLEARVVGKENLSAAAKFMQSTLMLSEVIKATIEDGERSFRREEISNDNFPRSTLPEIENQFAESWAHLIIRMLSDLKPYKAHGGALMELRQGWDGHDSTSRLASESLFEGVGMYWTLRDSCEHWRERNRIRSQSGQPALGKTDIVKAWDETEKKREEFEVLRAKHYLGSTNKNAIEASRGAYDIYTTYACQLGFVLAARSIALLGNVPFVSVRDFSKAVVDGANAGLEGTCPGDFNRLVFLWRDAPVPLNRIPRLDSPEAVYFRYFWLELLGTPEARPRIEPFVTAEVLDKAISTGRRLYLNRLRDVFKSRLKDMHGDWTDDALTQEATDTARKELGKSLTKWFGCPKEVFDAWLATLDDSNASPGPDNEPEASDTSDAELEQADAETPASIRDIIGDA